MSKYEFQMPLPLTDRQVMERLLVNDARNIRAMRPGDREHAWVIADCAQRLFDARAVDLALGGGKGLERLAESNLRYALSGWRGVPYK